MHDEKDAPLSGEEHNAAEPPKPGLGFVPESETAEPETPAPRKLAPAWIIGACAIAVLLAALALGALLNDSTPEGADGTVEAPPQQGETVEQAQGQEAHLPETGRVAVNATATRSDELPYEETLGVPLERLVRQVDYALIETLLFTGYDPHAMTISEMRLEEYHDERYHFQALKIELEGGPKRFLDILGKALKKWAPEAVLSVPEPNGDHVVSISGRPTHSLHFVQAAPKAEAPREGARLAVVIDDIGQSMRSAHALMELPYPVTFSVLPGTPHAKEIAAQAAAKGKEVLLHLPMEPKGWPGINPGPGALFTTMKPDEVRDTVAADLAEIPQAVGVNNHMGSRFTSHAEGMAVVLDELKARGMFFLDSLTAPNSTGTSQGKKIGLPVYRRNIFLDNIRDVGAILRQLEKAERVAASAGQAVAIGHPYPETVAALKKWNDTRDRNVRVVTVGELEPLK